MVLLAIREEDLIGTFEQKKAAAAQLNLMDDIFFSVVLEHKDAAEYLLTQLLGKPITVIETKTQYSIRNIEDRSIVLDALIEDDEGRLYDVEIQVSDDKDHALRMRYYRTAIDWSYLAKGTEYSKLPELYMIFITGFDPFKLNRTHYEIVQYVDNSDILYDDGIHRLYFNTTADDGSGLSKLLHYLENSDVNNNNFGALSQQVNYHKVSNKGVDIMSSAVEDLLRISNEKSRLEGEKKGRIEGKIEMVNNLLSDGFSIDKALKYAKIDRPTYEKYTAAQR